ncbi:MAG: hypothetical protein LBV41_09555 [Cytophagaceae bacterium]|jgi:hypothetical protein|nr:hypothetical protein [Cytophagaceae bacterium]
MEKKELEKQVDAKFKNSCMNLLISNYSLKAKKRLLEIKDENDLLVGEVRYDYKSCKFCELGAITTLNLSASVQHSKIGDILKNTGINYDIPPYTGYPMVIRRYNFLRNQKYPGGEDFSFYSQENIDERINDFIAPLEKDIIPRIDHYLNHKETLFEDIITKQDYYKYPYATLLITLYLNKKNSIENINILKGKAMQANLYDVKFSADINEKISSYFNSANFNIV